jgi:hypothetical protein
MRQQVFQQHVVDHDGNPAGGFATCGPIDGNSPFIRISWQNGPLAVDGERKPPNGAFVEDVIAIALSRLNFYQSAGGGKFACDYNQDAIDSLEFALVRLDARTTDREARGVEGSHTP